MKARSEEAVLFSICKLQNYIRARNAYKQIEEKTNLNVLALSENNFLALKQRLYQGSFLPKHIKALIQQEMKQPNDMLTPAELDLYSLLLAMPIYINHASPEAEKIEQSGIIHSKASLKANNISVRTHTSDRYGQEYYVFFSYGLRSALPLVVNFLCDNNAFIANLDDLQKKNPIIMSGSWCSGHFYAYDMQQTASPMTYQYKNIHTIVQTQYWIDKKTVVKYYRKLTFTYPDNTQATLLFDRSEEITAGNEIKRWHALKLIEFVRFLHPEIRKYILTNYANTQLIKEVYDSIFTPGKAEFHFPYQYKHGWTLEKRDKVNLSESKLAFDALLNNDIESLKQYVKSPAAQFYQYKIDGREGLSLLNIAVLRNNQPAITLLIKSGFDPNVEYLETRQILYIGCAYRTALQDAVELGDESRIQLLLNRSTPSDNVSITYTAFATFETIQAAIATKQDESILRLLLLHFPKLDGNLEQLLILASYYNHIPALKVLLESGAEINKNCKLRHSSNNAHLLHKYISGTPLTVAAEFGCHDSLVYLLQQKADCNQPARHCDSNYFNGNSPLMAAINGLATKKDKLQNDADRILRPYYLNNKEHSQETYLLIIDNLIKAGANLEYCDDNGKNVTTCIRYCLMKKKYSTLEQLLKELQKTKITSQPLAPTNQPNKTAAIITCKNENNAWLILLGQQKAYRDQVCLAIPGGNVDYEMEDNLRESITNITGAQTNLNLQEANYLSERTYLLKNHKGGNKKIFHFHFNSPIVPFKRSPASTSILYLNRSITRFIDISWVKVADLQLKKIEHQGRIFPMFYLDELPLPLYVCPNIAILYGIETPNSDELVKMAEYFSLNANDLTINAIKSGQLDDLKKYYTLGLFQNKYEIVTNSFKVAFQSRQYDVISWLLTKDLAISTLDLSKDILDSEISHPVDIIVALIKRYPDIMQSYGSKESLARYAGKYGAIPLIELIGPDFLRIMITSAIKNQQFNTLLYLQDRVEENRFANTGIQSLISWIFEDESKAVRKINSSLDFFNYFVGFNNPETNVGLCELTSDVLCALIKDESSNLEFDLLVKKITQILIRLFNDEKQQPLFPYYYINLISVFNKCTESNCRNNILIEMMSNIPVFALYCAAWRKKGRNYAEMDSILAKYVEHPSVQLHLKEYIPSFGNDADGNTLLHRAVKANQLSIVRMLATNKEANFNDRDKEGRTPLYNAMRLGLNDMAEFLREHGELVWKKYDLDMGIEQHARLIFRETYLQPFPGKSPKKDLYSLPVERVSHGVQHAIRTCIFTKMFVHFYQAMGHAEALKMSNEDIFLLQIAALCHDAMRESDMEDKWEDKSANYCKQYLLDIGVDNERAKLFANAIISRKDNLYGRILQSADCLEVSRVARIFYINRLAAFQDATPEYRRVLSEIVKQAIQLQAYQHDLKHSVEVRLNGAMLFSAQATRCTDKPELKQFYEQHSTPYNNTVNELTNYELINTYFESAYAPKPKILPDDIKWTDGALSCQKKNPLIIVIDKWVFYCYDDRLKAEKDLVSFKESIGTLFPDLLHHGRIVENKKHEETPFRIRLSLEQHQCIQKINSKENLNSSNPNLLFGNSITTATNTVKEPVIEKEAFITNHSI